MTWRYTWMFLAWLALAAAADPRAVLASGSYVSRPPQPKLLDAEKYEQGKAVFLQKMQGDNSTAEQRAAQLAQLEKLQSKLPVSVRRNTQLPLLAGKITAEQMKSLEYYLKVRFKVQ